MRITHLVLAAGLGFTAPAMAQAEQPWSGWYIGLNAGAAVGQPYNPMSGDFKSATNTYGMNGKLRLNATGFIGGVQAGYNIPLANNWLVGFEADLAGTMVEPKMHASTGSILQPWGNADLRSKSRLDYLGTVRTRVGYILPSSLLVYGTAGMAIGGVNNDFALTARFGNDVENAIGKRYSNDIGWTVGAGAEYPVTDKIRVKVEYLYADLGTYNVVTGNFFAPTATGYGAVKSWTTAHVARVGVNYALN